MPKVIAKFTDGSSYTWKGVFVDDVDWKKDFTTLWKDTENLFDKSSEVILHKQDLLCIMEKDKCQCVIWTNPKYKNICIEVETGKKRGSYHKISRKFELPIRGLQRFGAWVLVKGKCLNYLKMKK